MNERHCYCPPDGPQPAYLAQRGIPPGFCGICERCGRPGHARHFPGPVPYTGAWCDACYELVGARDGLRRLVIRLGVAIILARLVSAIVGKKR